MYNNLFFYPRIKVKIEIRDDFKHFSTAFGYFSLTFYSIGDLIFLSSNLINDIIYLRRGIDMDKDPFKEYKKETEPNKAYRGYVWSTAIGLQAVDGLKPSKYLIDTAIQNIEGKISIKEAKNRIDCYYKEKPSKISDSERTEEADKVSSRIAEILSEKAFTFSPSTYISIHKKLFQGIYNHAGKLRDFNISKNEWVLDGETVIYGSASQLRATLEYDFLQEQSFSYKNLSMDEIIHHLAFFISRLWQIHIFCEGNTRTTAVFFIKYLRMLGFSASNDIFAENAWYFRNALVRANYTNLQKGIHETTEYLEIFLRNLLLDEKNELRNRNLHISGLLNKEKVDIEDTKVDIEPQKVDIESVLSDKTNHFSKKTNEHIYHLFEKFGFNNVFGRSAIMELLNLKSSSASRFISKLVQANIIEPVVGHGKGKYKFKKE